VRVPPFLRLGCAGIAVITIAALTSIGLFAVVAGGLPFGSVATRVAANGAPVLVTIQAMPVTPTVFSVPTVTPVPASLIPSLGASARPAQAAPAPVPAAPAPVAATAGPNSPLSTAPASPASTPVPSPVLLASLGTEAPPTAATPNAERTATHDGVLLELAEIEQHWQPPTTEATTSAGREPADLLTVHLRFTNRASDVRYVADTDILLVGDDGSRYAPRTSGHRREPRLLTVPVPANDGLRGWLTYEVPPGTVLRGIQWSPTRPDRPRADATYMLGLPR
jgi:hypothetical protein